MRWLCNKPGWRTIGLIFAIVAGFCLVVPSCDRQCAEYTRLELSALKSIRGSRRPGILRIERSVRLQAKSSTVDHKRDIFNATGICKVGADAVILGVTLADPVLPIDRAENVLLRFFPKFGNREPFMWTAPVSDGIAVWDPVPVQSGIYDWAIEIVFQPETMLVRVKKADFSILQGQLVEPGFFRMQADSDTRPGLFLTPGTEAVLHLPEHGDMAFEASLARAPMEHEPASLELHIATADDERLVTTIVTSEQGWTDTRVDLGRTDKQSLLRLKCHNSSILIGNPALTPTATGTRRPPERANVLLISVDTVRGDHFPSNQSEAMNDFWARGVVFDRAIAQAPVTQSSHHSIFSGLQVPKHGGDGRIPISDDIPTLATLLADAGYRTAAFTEGVLVSAVFGFDIGFDNYWEYAGPARDKLHLPEILTRCENWLSSLRGSDSWLMFVHTYQAHPPFMDHDDSSRPIINMIPTQSPRPLAGHVIPFGTKGDWQPSELLVFAKQSYQSEIRYLSDKLAAFLTRLEQDGYLDNTIVIIVSDHGEGFYEHRLLAHNNSLYQELLHVPLLMRFPRDEYAGNHVRETVQTVDILPTVLDYLGVEPPKDLDGVSLLPACESEKAEHRPAMSTHGHYYSVIDWPYKLIVPRNRRGVELYHLDRDRLERKNLLEHARPTLIDSLIVPLTAMLTSAHNGYLLTVERPQASAGILTVACANAPRAKIMLKHKGDTFKTTKDSFTMRLVPSALGRILVLLPHSSQIRAGLGRGAPVGLGDGLTEVGPYRLHLQKCMDSDFGSANRAPVDIPDELTTRLHALGYLD